MDTPKIQLSPVAYGLIEVFESIEKPNNESKITVNRFVSEIATWYEKLRNAMDIREDEVILRAAIERILKLRLFLGGNGKKIAEPLIRELLWARYFPESSMPETMVEKVAEIIDLHLAFKQKILSKHRLSEVLINAWIYQLLSCNIAKFLSPSKEKEAMGNSIFHILKDTIQIVDDTEDTKNAQVFLAVHRAFAKDDLAFLKYYLFRQIFGDISEENIEEISTSFIKGYKEIEKQINYPLKEKIYLYVKKQTPVFFIFEDILRAHKGNLRSFIENKEEFENAVFEACEKRYKGISSKVRRAIVRSVFFLLLTKAFFALSIEGTYEKYVYGKVLWGSIALNTGIPPLLMIISSLFIKTPGKDNSKRILGYINSLLYEPNPQFSYMLKLKLYPDKKKSFHSSIFAMLWLCAFMISFGAIVYLLSRLHFNLVSQGIFIFFLTIVSFLTYKISRIAHTYTVENKQGLLTPFIDFLLLPIVRVGMRLTEGISQINILIFIFDFFIEAPFKGLFAFFEQWFVYMHTKREDLE